MVFLRHGVRAEEDELAVGEERETMAGDAFLDLLLDQPVGHQDVFAGGAGVEDEERILAVRRMDHAFEDHPGLLSFEAFQLAGAEVVAVGEDEPVLLRQPHAGVADGIHAHDRTELLVEDEEARGGFLVGPDLQ